jgi:iron complex outermembrane receptor protein
MATNSGDASHESNSYQSTADHNQVPWLFEDQYILSIATGFEQPIAKAPVVASIITAKSIRAMGATDIDQILESVPGLHIARSPIGYNPIYSFRGVYSGSNPQVLMLVDNMPITNLFHGDRNANWGGMPVEAISRIEVIRGPGSALYGADAFAGVINIITKSVEEIGAGELGLRGGGLDTRDLWLSRADSVGPVELSLVAELHKTAGSKAQIAADAQTWLDGLTGTRVSLTPRRVNLSRDNLDLRTSAVYRDFTLRAGLQRRGNWGDGAGVAQVVNPDNKFFSRRYNMDLHYQRQGLLPHFELDGRLSYLRTSQEVEGNLVLFPAGSTGPFFNSDGSPLLPDQQGRAQIFKHGVIGNPEVFEKHQRFSLGANYTGLERHRLSLGAGYYLGRIDRVRETKNFGLHPDSLTTGTVRLITPNDLPDGQLFDVSDTALAFMPEDRRTNRYLYVQDIWQVANDWELTAGLRYDHYSDFGSTTNPRLALVWANSYRLTTKLLYSKAFRAPSFAETKEVNNPVALGNPNLEPENITSYELAFDYRWDLDDAININFFYYDWDSIIKYRPDAGATTMTAQNNGRQTGYGLEFEVIRPITEHLKLTANYAWQRSQDRLNYADAVDSPERQLYINTRWKQGTWQIDMRGNWVVSRNRSVGDTRAPVKDYLLVDFSLRRDIFEHFQMALLVNNLFDKEVFEPSPQGDSVPFIPHDLPLAGRSVSAEIRYSF